MKKLLLFVLCIISLGLTAQLPSITTQPINTTVSIGGNTIYSVLASGTITGYQWQLSTNGGVSFNDISAAGINPSYGGWTTPNLTLSGIPFSANGYVYRCQVFGSSVSTVETLTTAGLGTWTCPAGLTSVTIQCWGAGGSGGSCPAGSNLLNSSGGGGGGAFSSSVITVIPGNAYAYIIGAGGSPTGTTGNPGGTTNFNNNAILAVGGQGGGWRAPDGYNPGGAGASGGSSASCVGSIRYSGGSGNAGAIGYCGGGGAGGAGTAANGGNAPGGINWTGGSGGANFGGNGGHGGSWADRGTYAGANGNSIGGGGGGSSNYGWSPNPTYGGSGANGAIKISYNASQAVTSSSGLLTVTSPPSITTTASPSIINCGESSTLTSSSTSAVQPCVKAELPATLQNGLVGYWPFCGNANDASGNGNNGSVNGATLTTDRFGNANSAYSFDGVNNEIVVAHNNSLNLLPITISVWFQTSISQSNKMLINKYVCESQNGYSFRLNENKPSAFYFSNGGTNNYLSLDPISSNFQPLNDNAWHHGLLIVQNDSTKVFNDGVLIHQGAVNGNLTITNTIENLRFGSYPQGVCSGPQNFFYNGKLDDIAIYNRALSASEIQQLYTLGNVSYSWSTGATTPSITVTPAQTTAYTCTATNSSGSTTSSVSVTVADTLTWTGALDTDWHKPCNWSPQFVPQCCNNVVIPLTSNQPIVSGVAAAEDLTIYTTNGAQLTVNTGANLQIADCTTTVTTSACPSLAAITTSAVINITQTTAVSGGTISYQGASVINARGVCWSTSINPTIANSFTTNGTGVGTFTSNLTGLTAGITYYVRAYATNTSGTSYGNQVSFVAVNPQPAYPANSVFCASGPTLVIDVTNPATGKTWMDRNLGASQVATSSTDAAAYGDLYQWGRGNDGHQCRTSPTTTTLSSTDQPGHGLHILAPLTQYDWRSPQNPNLWQGVNGINNPCPSGYRLPTDAELNADKNSWATPSINSAISSPLKFTIGGYRNDANGSLTSVGLIGYFWSSTVNGNSSNALNVTSLSIINTHYRAAGMSVRCIKN